MEWNRKFWACIIFFVLFVTACSFSLPDPFLKATDTPTPTPTATPSPTPTVTPSPTPSPTPTPLPTPLPVTRIQLGDQALLAGDYDQAQIEYDSVIASEKDPNLQAEALYGTGRIEFEKGNNASALEIFRKVASQFPDLPAGARSYYFQGKIYSALQRYTDAAFAFETYLKRVPAGLESFLQELRGEAYRNAGNNAKALEAYLAAEATPHLGSGESIGINIGRLLVASKDFDGAIKKYAAIYASSQNDYTKAQLDLLIGQAYLAQGNSEQANQRFLELVKNFPRSYDAYSALVALVNAGIPVDELERGIVDYYAGQQGLAVQAFDRYLAAVGDHSGAVHYYKAMALLEISSQKFPLGTDARTTALANGGIPEDQAAFAEFDAVIKDHTTDHYWTDAWDEKSYAQWVYLDQPDQAAQTLLTFVKSDPKNPRAPEFMFLAARYQERANLLEEAALTWERLADAYPSYEQTQRGLILAGISRYRLNNFSAAQTTFRRALLLSSTNADSAAAYFWIGKTQKIQDDLDSALDSWKLSSQKDPTGFYSERARDLILNRAPFAAPEAINLSFDLNAEKFEAEAWMRTNLDLPSETDLSGPAALANDPRFRRGQEFWRLGLYEEARSEFEDLRLSFVKDPVNSFRLIQPLLDMGIYRSAIMTARQVLSAMGLGDAATLTAPRYFSHIRFGAYYQDIILAAGKQEGIDPLLLFSVIRQESLFEGFVQSSAGARGVMQIVPATGQDIAKNLGWPPDYTDQDLYRPMVSIRLGAHYLAQQRKFLDGDLFAMLAAYNGGPGNAQIWQELAHGDLDLFIELIRYQETRDYVMMIFENYNIYRQLYIPNP